MEFSLVIAAVGPLIALCLHEVCHLAVARSSGPLSITVASVLPLRVDLDFTTPPSPVQLRLIALAPLLVGVALAGIALHTGLWGQIQQLEPYYLSYLVVLNWAVFSHLSVADLRLAWNPSAVQQLTQPTALGERV